jgi:hypothetical protein
LLVAGTEHHLLVWDLDTDTLSTIAWRAAGRNMTADGWEQYGWPDEPYHHTCPESDRER